MSAAGLGRRLRARRRKLVKRRGKRLIRSLADFMGRHSRIPDAPVLDPAHFPWASDLRADWKAVRAELDAMLAHRELLPRIQDLSPDQARISPNDLWHAVWNDTDEERVVLLFDFERPMDRRGRFVSRLLMAGLRRSAYYRDAYRNQKDWEDRYFAAVGSGGPARGDASAASGG